MIDISDTKIDSLRKKLLNTKFGFIVVGFVFLVSIIYGIDSILDLQSKHFGRADLDVLLPNDRIKSNINIFKMRDDEKIFMDGVEFFFSLSHNKEHDHSIIVDKLSIKIDEYILGSFSELNYKLPTPGPAGTMNCHYFASTLSGKDILSAVWYDFNHEIPTKKIKSVSDNFFSTTPEMRFKLSANDDDVECFHGIISANKNGLYRVKILVGYAILEKVYEKTVGSFTFYYDENARNYSN